MTPCAHESLSSTKITSKENENPLMALVDAATSVSNAATTSPQNEENVTSKDLPKIELKMDVMDKKLTFAEQLMAMLDDGKYSDVVQWMPNGDAFTIVNPKKFTRIEMPEVFNIRNMSSFVRKLTRWGFSRVHEKATMNSDIFKHKEFHRGERRACADIKCCGKPGRRPTAILSSKFPTIALPPKEASFVSSKENKPAMSSLPLQKAIHYPMISTRPLDRKMDAPHLLSQKLDSSVAIVAALEIMREKQALLTNESVAASVFALRILEQQHAAAQQVAALAAEQLKSLTNPQHQHWKGFSSSTF